MHITIDAGDPRPIYRQVADEIKALIASGALEKGAGLPSVRQLAADLGVNMNTIATAYRDLQAEGLIDVRHGSGARVASRRSGSASRDAIRKALRGVLAEMLLAGMKPREIARAVASELDGLSKGAKG